MSGTLGTAPRWGTGLGGEEMTGPAPRPPARLRAVPPRRRAEDAAPAAVATSDALLARGEPGLRFLAEHLPRRARLPVRAGLPPATVGVDAVRRRHERGRGTDLAALSAGVRELRLAATTVRGRHRALAEEAGGLWEQWAGPAAEATADRVVVVARAAHGVVSVLEDTADHVEDAVVAVTDALVAQADAALDLLGDDGGERVGGSTGADVDAVLDTLLDDVAPPRPDGPALLRAYAADLDARVRGFLARTDDTDAALDAAWERLAARLAVLRDGGAAGVAGDVAAGEIEPGAFALPLPVGVAALLAEIGEPDPDLPDP